MRLHFFLWMFLGLIGCATGKSTTEQTEPLTGRDSTVQRLCIVGREVRSMSDAACLAQQKAERDGQNEVDQLLNRVKLEYQTSELSVGLLESITLGAHYKYRLEPSYRDSYYTRLDEYTFSRDVNPASLLGRVPIGIGLTRDSRLLFAQQFASGAQARDPRSTYLPTRIPVTAERALALKVGDYVRFNTQLSLLANAGQVLPIGGFALRLQAGYSILVEGEYEIHLFRLDEDRVRLRLVGQRARERGLAAGVETTGAVAAAVINRIDNRLEPLARLAGIDAEAGFALSKTKSDLFLVDYTLDLRHPEARDAFAGIFNPIVSLQDVSIANPLRGSFRLRDRLLATIEPLDQLARQDYGGDTPRVVRHFQGVNYSSSRGIDFKARLSRFEVTRSRLFRENFLVRSTLTPTGNETEYYLLPVWSRFRERSMLFGMLDESQSRSADALFVADADGKPIRFLNIGFAFDYKDSNLRPSEYRRLRRKIELLLPEQADVELARLLEGTNWLRDDFRRNLSLQLDYLFREAAFDGLVAAGYATESRVQTALVDFIYRAIEAGEFPLYTNNLASLVAKDIAADAREAAARARIAQRWRRQIDTVSASLARAFNAGSDGAERMNAVLDLRRNGFYQSVGTAFWVDMIDRAQLDLSEAMFVSLRLDADDHLGVEFEFGHPGERQLYRSVKLIQTLLNDRSLDMREPGDLDTVISRMIIVSDAEPDG